MKYAIFNEQGFPKAFFSPDIHGERFIEDENGDLVPNPDCKIPEEAIEITDEQWFEFINNQGRRRWNFEKKEVIEYIQPPSLDKLKQQKLRQLKQELQNFIYSHYDQGTQASFTALYQIAKEQNNTNALTQIQRVWNWINSVLNYYYSKKDAIKNADTQNELDNIIWDWSTVGEIEHVELRGVVQLLNQ